MEYARAETARVSRVGMWRRVVTWSPPRGGDDEHGDGEERQLRAAWPLASPRANTLDELVDVLADRVAAQLAEVVGSPSSPWLTVEEAADRLRCPPSRIYDLKARGELVSHRDGRRLLFRREDLDAVLVREA
jgi:excisionase family DNA binding protein